MPPKGIDYSKWDKMQLSSDGDDDGGDKQIHQENNDDGDGYDDNGDQQKDASSSSSSQARDLSDFGSGAVRKLDGPSTVTFGGGGGVTVRTPTAAPPPPVPAAAAAAAAVPKSDDGDSVAKNNNKNNTKKKSRWIRNGCFIPADAAAPANNGFGRGLFWSQTSDSVSVGIVLEIFTFREFLALQEEEHTALSNNNNDDGSLDATIRLWNNRKGARKVSSVNVQSVTTTETETSGAKVCSVAVTDKQQNKSSPLLLAYDAEALDTDDFWSVHLVSAPELGLSMLPPQDPQQQQQRLETLLAVRAVVVELRKKATVNLVSGVRHWWDKLLVGGGAGAIDVATEIDDRKDTGEKRAAMKQAWDEAHELFKERVAARRKVDPFE